MDIEINEVQEIIKNLDGGELSIKEEKYLKVAKLCVQLAAENTALKSAVTKQIELRSEIKKAGRPPHADFWVQSICEVEDRVSKALNGTPATDRIVSGIKADGVEEFSKTLEGAADICGKSKAWEAQENLLDFAERGFSFAKQLREGANHD